MRVHDQQAGSLPWCSSTHLVRCTLSVPPRPGEQIPPDRAGCSASNPKATTAMRVRNRLDWLWHDEDFADWYPRDGRPGLSPAQPATVCVRNSCSACRTVRPPRRCAAASTSSKPWPSNWTIPASTTACSPTPQAARVCAWPSTRSPAPASKPSLRASSPADTWLSTALSTRAPPRFAGKTSLELADERMRPPWRRSSVSKCSPAGWRPPSSGEDDLGLHAGPSGGRSGGVDAARRCQQALGGIGFTAEHPRHRHLRRAVVLDGLLGSARELPRPVQL